jgi:prophage tail gpP-like protein
MAETLDEVLITPDTSTGSSDSSSTMVIPAQGSTSADGTPLVGERQDPNDPANYTPFDWNRPPTPTPHLTRPGRDPIPNPEEVAELVVEGFRFTEWESVWVQHRFGEAFHMFQFTAAEREPYPNKWQALRFHPDDHVIITLGGHLAMNGVITIRQVAYDKKSHGVQLQGKGITHWAYKSSVDNTQTGSFDGQSFEQIARAVLAPYPSPVRTEGNLDATPFKRCSNQPGETCWDFLERLARPRGIIVGSDYLGNAVLSDDRFEAILGSFIEGYNILRCQAIIDKDPFHRRYSAMVQTNNDGDEKSPSQAGEMMKSVGGSAPVYSHKITPAEQPVWNDVELQKRAASEALWTEGAIIEVNITVQGWINPQTKDIWRVGKCYKVVSPMISFNGVLAAQTITFQQDRSSGTTTTLMLVLPPKLKINTKFANTQPIVGANQTYQDGPAPMPPANPVPYVLPPGTMLTPNGIVPKTE